MSAGGSDTDPGTSIASAEDSRVSYLDATLWSKLADARSPREMAEFWLQLQCLMLSGVSRACTYLDVGDERLTPVAFYPRRSDGPTSLLGAARKALTERKGVVSGHNPGKAAGLCCAAYPFIVDDTPCGAVAIELEDRSEQDLRAVMRALQWGAAWMEVAMRRLQACGAETQVAHSAIALDLVGLVVEEQDFKTAAKALVTEVATRLDCDLVGLGLDRNQSMDLVALSHTAEFGNSMNVVRAFSAAMQEAADQESAILYPAPAGAPFQVTRAHAELSQILEGATVLSLPILAGDAILGALLFERCRGRQFDQADIDLCDALAALVGPILAQKRREERHILLKARDAMQRQAVRLLGPDYLGRKLALGVITLLVLLFSVWEGPYRVTASARIEGEVKRVLVAPFDGYVASQSARAGDRVSEGEVLAVLDDRDLSLEHTRWVTTRQQRLAEYDQMVAKKDRTGAKIARAQIEQAEAHIALLAEQLRRTRLSAPFGALVVSGDLSQSVGAAVSRGEQLFELAPLNSYRVILEVDESRLADIKPGQTGRLKIAALLDETLDYTISQIVPITSARDGRNFFRVEATLNESHPRLRPGMEGVGKTVVENRLLIGIWTRELTTWLRLKLWAWWP
jgi:multidrug resistance efflux pump